MQKYKNYCSESKLGPLLLGISYRCVSFFQKFKELLSVELVFSSQLAGVLLLEVRANDIRRYKEPPYSHEDAGLAGLIVAEEVDFFVEDDG